MLIKDIVYAELSVRFTRIEDLDVVVEEARLVMSPLPGPALFLAAKVFQRYRAAGGTRIGVLPDFFIGAHAAVESIPLLTRDAQRYRTFYPTVRLITPSQSAAS